MEKPRRGLIPVILLSVVLLGAAAFSCSVAAEFKKSKRKDIKLDGNLCHLPRSAAYGLGVAALACLSVAQVAGTTVAAANLCAKGNRSRRTRSLSIALLVLSWISFGLAAILLGMGSSMNDKQPYGRGWMHRECYVVKDGVYVGSAVLAASTVIFIIGFVFTTTTTRDGIHRRTGPDEERIQRNEEQQQQQEK